MSANLPASIKARLLNLARREGHDPNRLLLLYAQERLLARLAQSSHRAKLVLKGGVLLYGRYGTAARPTKDLDFLGRATPNELDAVATMLREIAQAELEDGLRFDAASLLAERIKEGADHEGVRLKLHAMLGTARVPLQVDVGFGDAATPEPFDFPALLDLGALPRPQILAYSLDTVIAEKLQAMTVLGTANSRAKDFYDMYRASREDNFRADTLARAVRTTFEHRGTPFEAARTVLAPGFAENQSLRRVWAAWRRNNRPLEAPEDFDEVVRAVRALVLPIVDGTATGTWQPEAASWSQETARG